MDVNAIIARIGELEKIIEQSAANHNGLVGRLMELKDLLARLAEPAAEIIHGVEEIAKDVVDVIQ